MLAIISASSPARIMNVNKSALATLNVLTLPTGMEPASCITVPTERKLATTRIPGGFVVGFTVVLIGADKAIDLYVERDEKRNIGKYNFDWFNNLLFNHYRL
jgi:hypothetical protein